MAKRTFKRGMDWAKSLDKPIEDANEPLKITLTKADIKNGVPMDQRACAFAKGICRQEYAANAWVGISQAFVEWTDVVLRYDVPQSVARELVSFDRSHLAEVGEFHLSPPYPSHRLGNRSKPTGIAAKPRKKLPRRNHYTANIRNRDYK